jgi:hypothetical protein
MSEKEKCGMVGHRWENENKKNHIKKERKTIVYLSFTIRINIEITFCTIKRFIVDRKLNQPKLYIDEHLEYS